MGNDPRIDGLQFSIRAFAGNVTRVSNAISGFESFYRIADFLNDTHRVISENSCLGLRVFGRADSDLGIRRVHRDGLDPHQ
ncbi:MAG: hypothetical protein OTI35_08440 [Sulfitobacter sp.]|nr:hypothetical protein [Sulfitobacter sp.]